MKSVLQRVLNNCSSPPSRGQGGAAHRPKEGLLSEFFNSLYISQFMCVGFPYPTIFQQVSDNFTS